MWLLKHVLHVSHDDQAVRILMNCRSVMAPENRLLVIECVLPSVTCGKNRSGMEWQRLLERSGLSLRRVIPVAGDPASVTEAALSGA